MEREAERRRELPGPCWTNSGGGAHAGALAPSSGPLIVRVHGGGPAATGGRRPPAARGASRRHRRRRAAGGVALRVDASRASNTPSLFASRSTVMLFAAGRTDEQIAVRRVDHHARRAKFGGLVTVKPFGTFGVMPSGRRPRGSVSGLPSPARAARRARLRHRRVLLRHEDARGKHEGREAGECSHN